jgi:N-methylhydantoinase A
MPEMSTRETPRPENAGSVESDSRRPLILGIDAGGTMTDTLLVDRDGRFVVGKAPTTPDDESVGLLESVEDGLTYVGEYSLEEFFGHLEVCIYAGTTMLNTLLSRRGSRLGAIVTRGFEDMIHQGRGVQTWAEYSYNDRLHAVTHVNPPALLPKERVRGVTERIDVEGDPIVPLYEEEVEGAAAELIEQGVEAVCICLLMSYVNDEHERRAGEIVEAVAATKGVELPVFLSSHVRPVTREVSRANSTLIEAYASAPVRVQLEHVEEAVQERRFRRPLQTMLAYGGLADIRYPRLHETLISGPVGGVVGARYLGSVIGEENMVLSDLGGTSFDVATITNGRLEIENETSLARFRLNLPTVKLESIGAGAGTIIKVDPLTKKIELGPESAQSDPGPACFGKGGDKATICDCDLLLGYLNPDNFLGGKVRLRHDLAEKAVAEQVTGPLGVDLYEGAEGIVRMLEGEARETLRRLVSSRGFDVSDYVLLAYGGAGPLHVAGYSSGLGFRDVLTVPYAAAFSAFGTTVVDYSHRYSRSVHAMIRPGVDAAERAEIVERLEAGYEALAAEAREGIEREGQELADLVLTPSALIRYIGQLDDVPVNCPGSPIEGKLDLDALLDAWEEEYERINRRVSKYSQAGHQVTELTVEAMVPTVKPEIRPRPLGEKTPSAAAAKGERRIYWDKAWHEAAIWDMELIVPGNEIIGPAVVEHPATTFVIPPGQRVRMDELSILHLREDPR